MAELMRKNWLTMAPPTVTGGGQNQVELELKLYGADEQNQVMTFWRQLEERLQPVPVASSSVWTGTWLKEYCSVVRPWFVLAFADNQLQGICLLSQVENRCLKVFPVTQLYLGTAGEPHGESVCVEYNDLLVADAYREQFLKKLQHLLNSEPGWDQFLLNGVPVLEGGFWPKSPGMGKDLKPAHTRVRDCRFFDLKTCREEDAEILPRLGKSTRSNLKRRIKQLAPLKVEWAETLPQAEHIFQELIELHQARWEAVGEPGAFASHRFADFQKNLIREAFPRGQVVLTRITSDDETIGCLYLLNDRNRLLDYVSGFASFEQATSPGLVSHFLCMEEAMSRGFDAYDFLVGEKRHKENLGKSVQQLQWMTCERNRVCFRLRDRLASGKRAIKAILRRGKQS